MGIRVYQVGVPDNTSGTVPAVKLVDLPVGPASIALSIDDTSAVCVGTNSDVNRLTGAIITPSSPIYISIYPGSARQTLYAVSRGGPGAVSAIISTPN
jgi:hypothetical protein